MILYIHPKTQMLMRSLVPMSLPALINRLPQPVLGLFEDEVTPDVLRKARIVLMDIHWYLSIHPAVKLSHKIKSINPQAVIIAGGLSAGIFSQQILRDSKIDYIIRGDAEIPLKELVAAILNNLDVSTVPNAVSRDFCSPNWYALTASDMDESDYCNISFFPSLGKDVVKLHNSCHGYPLPAYPFLTTMRGCPLSCNRCYGAPNLQKSLFNRSMVVRSAQRVRDDLISWSNNADISFVNIYHDFITLLPWEYAGYILSQSYKLYIYYEFSQLPSTRHLELLNIAFKGGIIVFPLDQYHATSAELCDVRLLTERIKQAQKMKKFEVRLSYVKRFAWKNPAYRNKFLEAREAARCAVVAADSWWTRVPIPNAAGSCGEKDYQYFEKQYSHYQAVNAMFGLGIFLRRYFPMLIEFIARRIRRFF